MSRVLGVKGEEMALAFLKAAGFKVLHQNWRYRQLEVDLIAQDIDELVFVEVKWRRSKDYGYPEESINSKKIDFLAEAADAYIERSGYDGEIRFDVLAITGHQAPFEFYHIKDAFFPGL